MNGIHVGRRCFEHLASIHTFGHIRGDLCAKCFELVDEVVQIRYRGSGSMIPRQKEFVLNKRRWNGSETCVYKGVVSIIDIGDTINLMSCSVCKLDKE